MILTVVLLIFIGATKSISVEKQFMARLIENEWQFKRVDAFLCWSLDHRLKLVKDLSKRNVLININDRADINLISDNFMTLIVDLSCDGIGDFLKKEPYKWILLVHRGGESSILNNLELLPDSDVTLLVNNNATLSQNSVYKRSRSQDVIMEEYSTLPKAVRRMDLQNTLIRLCYVLTNNDSINHLSDYKDKEIDTITKVNFILTNILIDMLNASRSFSFVDSWGYKDEYGNWSGMIGQLIRKEADIGGSPLFFTADRVLVIDYIAMPTPTRSKFVFKQPKLSYVSNVFLLPFTKTVWYCSMAMAVILGFFLYLSSKWEWKTKMDQSQIVSSTETLRVSLGDSFIMTIGAICQQGSNVQLKGPVGRIVILLLFLAPMFLYTSYSANIVALLQSSSSRIRTLSDLLNSRLKFAVHDTVFNRHYFSTATEPVRRAIYQKKIAPPREKPRFISLDEGVQNIRQGLFAFHMEIGVGYKRINEIFQEAEKCGLQEIQYLQVIDPWLAVQKDSPYREMFKIGFRRLQEFGLQSRENSVWYTKKPKCSGKGSGFISVGIIDCFPAMMVLTYGVLISLALFFIEFFYKKLRSIKLNIRK